MRDPDGTCQDLHTLGITWPAVKRVCMFLELLSGSHVSV